jgi:hypothetical protein
MSRSASMPIRLERRYASGLQWPIWGLMLAVVFVAIAIVDIQNLRRTEPVLVALAAAGYAGYGLMCWLAWRIMGRCRSRLGGVPTLIVYMVMMGCLFLVATLVYLILEYAYLRGYFPHTNLRLLALVW